MGANLNTRQYPAKLGKEVILKQWDDDCEMSRYEHGHSYSGEIGMLSGKPVFTDKQFETESEADDFICDNHEKWSAPLAVSYKHRDGELYWMIGGWCSS